MKVSELYERCLELTGVEPSGSALRYLHETLVLACAEALNGTRQGFGNVFAQVDYLCKRNNISMKDRIAIQLMRRHSNGGEELTMDDWRYDLRALVVFISAIFKTDVPHELVVRLPVEGRSADDIRHVNQRYIRCVVTSWDKDTIYATTEDGPISIKAPSQSSDLFSAEQSVALRIPLTSYLSEGMQLNLLDCTREGTTVEAGLIVVEPDFLVDISAIAACFQDYGHHPLSYLISRMKPRSNTQPILLGNFAGTALDDIIHQQDADFGQMLRTSFREQALQFCTCEGFRADQFKSDGLQQIANIREAVEVLFEEYDRSKALLEPSFVCERLGLQGRVDLMTEDMRLLVEQKSGKNWGIECPSAAQRIYKEDHYVQLLLYYGVLRYNFQLPADQVDIRLLYSKYPARKGLLVVNYYQQLFREAIRLRNCIVANEIQMAREGFATMLPQLQADVLLEQPQKADFFNRYVKGEIDRLLQPLHQLSPVEHDYVERMLTFVLREQLAQKVGVQEGQGGSQADLWNMPLSEKIETGNIILGNHPSIEHEVLLLHIMTTDAASNFRRGDMVYAYRYEGEPDVRANILYKGTIERLTDDRVGVKLNDVQQSPLAFIDGTYAIEHASSDIGTTSAIRALMAFCTSSPDRRDLLMGLRAPCQDTRLRLTRSYHQHYDDVLLRAKQARDYFLLQGPPGTGKTSMALRFLVEEELNSSLFTFHFSLLLTAYTHRAVDEICGMLEESGQDYLRLGSEASCDPRFVHRLLDQAFTPQSKLDDIRQRLRDVRIVVGTTSTLQARPFLMELKHFSLCIVDEASQILEPNIIGLLASEHIDRFILIGDHKQLPAVVQQPDDEPRLHECRLSLFERLLRQEREAGRNEFTGLLNRQGRMHPDIAAFPNELFYAREQLQPVPLPHQEEAELDYHEPSEDALDDLLKQRRVIFLPSEEWTAGDSFSEKVNPYEAHLVADLLRRIYRQVGEKHFDAARTVGVIVPYRNQIAMIRREIEQLGIAPLRDISIDTVERYQGSQRDVIIYSFTVRKPYQLDFLTSNCFEEDGHTIDRKLNVAMTRARKQLLMTGKRSVLQENRIFRTLIQRYSI